MALGMRTARSKGLLVLGLIGSCSAAWWLSSAQASSQIVLEGFQTKEADGFPAHWEHESHRSQAKGREAYKVQSEADFNYLAVRDAGQRIKKKQIDWDPKAYPILVWKWRLHKAPDGVDPIVAVYASLDTDLLFIPVFTKYVWSTSKAEGTLTEGGMFSGSEIVVQSGTSGSGHWVEERVNVYEDFKRIHHHEPAVKAWGISIFAGPGVEVDIGPITVTTAH